MALDALTIAGVEKKDDLARGWDISRTANGKSSFRGKILSEDGSYRPALDAEVFASKGGVTLFGGEIETTREHGLAGAAFAPILTDISVRDFSARTTRRYVTATIPAGTLKAALLVIVPYLHGVTLDAAQVDGPALPELIYADVRVDEVLKHLVELTGGWIYEIDEVEVFRMYAPGTIAAPFDITVENAKAIGDVTVEPTRQDFANRVIVRTETVRVLAEDAASIAARGPWEMLVTAPDTTSEASAQSLADTILARALVTLKRVQYATDGDGLKPGQTQVITLPGRNLSNTFLITDVVTRAAGPGQLLHQVTAIEGLVYQTGFRETYRRWNGGGTTVAGAGGSGGALPTRFAYFLGGSGIDATRSAVPTWMPAAGGKAIGQGSVQVQINTIPRGTTAATITARLRALDAAVSVKARLYDVTDNVACPGESALVTSTAWQTVVFSVTLTPGSHFYELQLLPGAANKDVLGTGYLE